MKRMLALLTIVGSGLALRAEALPPDDSISRLVEQLGSDHLEERERATQELEKLGKAAKDELQKAAPSIARFLEDPTTDRRERVAFNLVKLGSALGVEPLLGSKYHLFGLNHLRNAQGIRQLTDLRWGNEEVRFYEEILREVARRSDLTLHLSPEAKRKVRIGRIPRRYDEFTGDLYSALCAVCTYSNLEFVLEKDSIRILTWKEARDFWTAWWSSAKRDF